MDLGRSLGAETLEVRALLSGQTVQLIEDVDAVEAYPAHLTPAGTNLFFEVEDSTDSGVALAADNAGGTQVVLDTGSSSFQSAYYGGLNHLTAVGNSLFFLTGTGEGNQLWTSDGTAAGTAPLSVGNTTSGSMTILDLTAMGNTLLCDTQAANASGGDDQLWAVSPGATTATLIKDFGSTAVSTVGEAGSTLYLSVGGNLWSTDGTAQNTKELTTSASKPIPSPSDIFAFNGQAYYLASGTSSSTIGVLGGAGETPAVSNLPTSLSDPVVAGSVFYFTAAGASNSSGSETQLWASGGTQASTTQLVDFSSISSDSAPTNLTVAGGSLFFTVAGSDGLGQLWTSNGTSQGTTLVKDLGVEPQGNDSGDSGGTTADPLAAVGGMLDFTAFDSTHGAELWADTVATGTTQLVKDIDPGAGSSDPQDMVDWQGELYFSADDNTASAATSELWTSGGTSGTTTRVATFSPGITGGAVTDSTDLPQATLGSDLLLPLDDGIRGTSLWATDGTAAGTRFLAAVDPTSFAVSNGSAYFLGDGGESSFGLWTTDGTSAGTTEVMDLSQYGPVYGSATTGESMAVSGSQLYFITSDSRGGVDLWVSNGTAQGTSIVQDFTSTSGASGPSSGASIIELTPFAGELAFVVEAASGDQAWITGGTAGGTQLLTDLSLPHSGSDDSSPSSFLTVANGSLYFISGMPGDSSGSEGLWSSGGTPATTREIVSFPSPPGWLVQPSVQEVAVVGDNLFFALEYPPSGGLAARYQVWTSDGTAAGTKEVPVGAAGSSLGELSDFMVLGNTLLFQASVLSGGTGLWSTDGTAAGTTQLMVLDQTIDSYSDYYASTSTVVDGGIVYFAADGGADGTELWQSDGTSGGTFLVDDIDPGPASSDPVPLAVVGGQVVLAANDGIHGSELMEVVSTSQTAPPQLAMIPPQAATVDEPFQLDVGLYAEDPNVPASPLTYSLGDDAPAGMTIDPNSGIVTWPASSDQVVGAYSFTVTVTVSDDSPTPLSVSELVELQVNPVEPPTLAPIPGQFIGVGHTFELDVSPYASDPNEPPFPLTFSLVPGEFPAGATIDPNTGLLTWPTASNQAATSYSFAVEVADDGAPPLTATGTFTVQVNPVQPPGLRPIASQAVDLGKTFTLNLSNYANDPNTPALPLTYSLNSDLPAGAGINPTTGVLTWTPSSNQPTGPQTFTVTVSDNSTPPNTASEAFTVTVDSASSELPPSLANFPEEFVTAGETLNANLSEYASDPNTPPLPFTFSLGPDAPAGATIDPNSGVLTWAAPANQPAGPVSFTVIVSDDQSTPARASEKITVDVESLEPPTVVQVPVMRATIGTAFSIGLSHYASDTNSPPLPLTYSLISGSTADMSLNPTTGAFSWTPAAADGTGTYTITFKVADDGTPPRTADGTLIIDVGPAGETFPPVLQALPAQYVTAGETLTADLGSYASDPNSPALPLTFSLGNDAPAGATIDPTTGVLTWAAPSDQATGPLTFTVVVSDDQAPTPARASAPITVDVETPQSPSVETVPARGATIGQAFSINLNQYASDPNSPALPLTYSLVSGGTADMGLTPAGLFTWTPTAADGEGTYTITFKVADDGTPQRTADGTLIIDVAPSGQLLPPVLQSLPEEVVTAGETLTANLAPYASDPNANPLPLTFSLGNDAPAGATIGPTTGVLTWPAPSDQPTGPVTFTVIVSDDQTPTPARASGTITVNVDALTAPIVQTIPVQDATIGHAFSIDLSHYALDPNSPAYSLTYSVVSGATADASLDPATGEFSWTPRAADGVGTHTITFKVADDSSQMLSTGGTLTVDVSAPAPQPPSLRPLPDESVTMGETLTANLGPYASDPNANPLPLTFSLGNDAPAGATIGPTTGVLTWAAPSDQPTGPVTFTVIVSDDQTPTPAEASGTITVDVLAVKSPVIGTIPAQAVYAGQTFNLGLGPFASDPNSPPAPLSFALLAGAPANATLSSSGAFSWATPSGQAIGPVTIHFKVTDNLAPASPQQGSFTIDVSALVLSPVVHSIPTQDATIGQPFTLSLGGYASDPNTPPLPLTYTLAANAPAGVGVDRSTGLVTWTPQAGQPTGPTTFSVDIADDRSPPNVAVAVITIDVAPAPPPTILPPVLQAVSQAPSVEVGQTFTLDVSKLASDPNPTPLPLSYGLGSGAPAGASISPSTGLLSWNVPSSQKIGTYPVTVIVSDNSSPAKTVSETIGLSVVDPGPAPTITSPAVNTKKGFSITFGFSVPVDPATASDAANYILTMPGKKPKGKHRPIPPPTVVPARLSYNQATSQVTLKLAKKPRSGTVLTLTIVGSGPGGVAKLDGLQLAGSGSPGTNFVATIRGKGISPAAAVSDHTIVVHTASAHPALVRRGSASPAVRLGSASGTPGGPLAVAHAPAPRHW